MALVHAIRRRELATIGIYQLVPDDVDLEEVRGQIKTLDQTPRDFDKEAALWDAPPRVKLAADVFRAIAENLQLKADMDILDFGCGTGLVALPLGLLVRSITGADTSKGMLEVLKGKVQRDHRENVRTLYLDPVKNDLISGRYHAIVSSMTLHHVLDIPDLLTQFHQVLLPGGHIAIADLDAEGGRFHDNNEGVFHFGFDREKLGQLFLEAGFSNISIITAAQMNKPDPEGRDRVFTIFLAIARKHGK